MEWTAIGIPLANHLWQSTLFAAVAGVVTLLLRKNRAHVRYWLWLTASLKFLLPFSLLVGIGSHWSVSKAPRLVQPELVVVAQQIGQPFATPALPSLPPVRKAPPLLPALLLVAWSGGCVGVLFFWCLRWRRITTAARGALPLEGGRELEARRRLERKTDGKKEIRIIASSSALEPGVIGIFRPVLVVPAGIADRLTDAQLEAILSHELCHVRRRDNLAAALHMLVEALFWFHPLVWWIGTRLVDERERACDEEVVRLGSEPEAYAEGILKVCKFYLESPLACVAGVTGSNLKKRIEDIMSHRISHKLDFARKLLLASMGVSALVVPIIVGLLNPSSSRAAQTDAISPVFASVSIKPHAPEADPTQRRRTTTLIYEAGGQDYAVTDVTVKDLVANAYNLMPRQISGGPDWLTTQAYDITAKVEEAGTLDQVRIKLQNLLADRFRLKFHRETKQEPLYELVVGTNGSKLKEVPPSEISVPRPPTRITTGHLDTKQTTMQQLAAFLSTLTGRMVLEKTDLKGVYDFTLNWTPGNSQSLMTAVQEQLGLELKPQTAPVENLIIDSAEKPVLDQTLSASIAPPPFEVSTRGNESAAGEGTQKLVEAIMVHGYKNLPVEAIEAQLAFRPGDIYSQGTLEQSFNSLWRTGYFSDVHFEREPGLKGWIVHIYVKEKTATDTPQALSESQSQRNDTQLLPSSSNLDGKQPDNVLLARAKQAMQDARYVEARGLFQTLIQSHPNSEYVPLAKLSIANAWYAEGNLKQAELEYKDFVTFFPNRPEVGEAQSKLASIRATEAPQPQSQRNDASAPAFANVSIKPSTGSLTRCSGCLAAGRSPSWRT
jgi:uncharacterized protein (TIGR03435 family)